MTGAGIRLPRQPIFIVSWIAPLLRPLATDGEDGKRQEQCPAATISVDLWVWVGTRRDSKFLILLIIIHSGTAFRAKGGDEYIHLG